MYTYIKNRRDRFVLLHKSLANVFTFTYLDELEMTRVFLAFSSEMSINNNILL